MVLTNESLRSYTISQQDSDDAGITSLCTSLYSYSISTDDEEYVTDDEDWSDKDCTISYI